MSPVATPTHCAVLVVEHLGGGEARIDLDAERLGLLRRASGRRCRARRRSCRGCSSAAACSEVGQADAAGLAEHSRSGPSVTWVLSGASRPRASPGSSSSRPIGSITAPDRMWAPTSEPFSTTTTARGLGRSCFSRIAADEAGRAGADDHHVVLHALAGHGLRLGQIHRRPHVGPSGRFGLAALLLTVFYRMIWFTCELKQPAGCGRCARSSSCSNKARLAAP